MKKWIRVFSPFLYLIVLWSFYYYPYEYGRLWHLISGFSELYSPNILENGVRLSASREYLYDLDFEHFDYHEVGILFGERSIPSSFSKSSAPYVFSGKVVVELLSDGNVVRKKIVTKPLSYKFDDDDIGLYDSMVLERFPLPFRGKYSGFKIKVTILESDHVLEKNDVAIYFSVSTAL